MAKNENDTRPSNTIVPIAFSERQAAMYAGVSTQFLRQMRHYGDRPGRASGPPWIKIGGGRSIRYLKSDLDEWLAKHRHHPAELPKD